MVVWASTSVAKLICTSTCHVVTTFYLWNPKSTIRTLLELTTIHKLHKLLVFFWQVPNLLVLLAIHSFVVFTSALNAVSFLARHTLIFCQIVLNLKHSWTAGSRTPACCATVLVNEYMKRKLKIFCFYFLLYVFLNICYSNFWKTCFFRTNNRKVFGQNFAFKVLIQAGFMKKMATSNRANSQKGYFLATNGTLQTQISILDMYFLLFFDLFCNWVLWKTILHSKRFQRFLNLLFNFDWKNFLLFFWRRNKIW